MAEGPDGVRSWFVAFSILIINLIVAGLLRSGGILFVAFIYAFKTDRRGAALPASVLIGVKNLIGPAVGILGQKYGIPAVTIVGSIMGCLSFVLCSFSPDIMWITIFFGGMFGTAAAMIRSLPLVVIGQYFEKHRTTACGLAYTGGCIGSIVLPVLLDFLLQSYGLNGTFIILSGMMLQILPCAMLLKKPRWLTNLGKQRKCINDLKIKERGNLNARDSQSHPIIRSSISNRCHELCNKGQNTMNIYQNTFATSTKSMVNKTRTSYRDIHMNDMHQLYTAKDIAPIGLTTKNISHNSDYIFDTDLDYLKRMDEIIFELFSIDFPHSELSYRTILPQTEDDIWRLDKKELMKEIENIYFYIEKTFEMNYISKDRITVYNLRMKRMRKLELKEKTETFQDVKTYFLPLTERKFHLGKTPSLPNISKIYNDFIRKNYIMTQMRELHNSNELQIIHILKQYHAKDVQKVLYQIRNLYRLYSDLKFAEDHKTSEMHKISSTSKEGETTCQEGYLKEIIPMNSKESKKILICKAPKNTFSHHIQATFKLHMNLMFLLICFSRTVFHLTFATIVTIIVDFVMDIGLERDDGKYVIGALSCGDLLGRLCLGWITDHGFVTLPRYMLVVTLIQGLCTTSLPFMQSRWSLLLAIFLFGVVHGSLFIQQSVLIVKHIKSTEQSIAAGCMDFFGGIIGLILAPYLGFFRDRIGSYNPTFYINGAIALLSGLTWLLEPYAKKKNRNEIYS